MVIDIQSRPHKSNGNTWKIMKRQFLKARRQQFVWGGSKFRYARKRGSRIILRLVKAHKVEETKIWQISSVGVKQDRAKKGGRGL